MGRGRAPCCDKNKVKRGPWSPAEDLRLITFIQKHGHGNWRSLPKQSGLLRCGKSCRLRWINYLRPDVKRGNFTKEEEETIIKLHQSLGNKWSKIASYLPGRTDNEIKNVWNTHLKKRVTVMIKKDNANNGEDDIDANSHKGDEPKEASSISTTASSSISSYASNYSSDSSTSGVLKDVSDHQQVIKQQQQQSCYISNSDHDHDDHQQVIDIDDPLEPSDDIDDFWDMMLDKLDPLDDQSNFENSHQFEASQGSISFGEDQIYHHHHDLDKEIEYRKWLRYLENELGLIDNQDQAINSTTSHGHGGYHQAAGQLGSSDNNEMMMMMMMMVRPDFDQEEEGNCYFQICSSPPQNIGI